MKKMTAIIAAVLCVGIAQAVSLSWNISGLDVAAPDNTMSGVDLAGAIVYGFVGDAADIAAVKSAAAEGSFATWLATVAPADSMGTAQTSSTGLALKSNQGTFTTGDIVSVFLVVFDSATAGTANNFLVTSLQTRTMGATNPTYGFGAPGGTYVPSTWTDIVPEPTSMALLALGAAVVGLRRKFRK